MTISRRFVRLMGGDITVESEVGKGSVFKFDIPVEVVEAAEIETEHIVYDSDKLQWKKCDWVAKP